MEQEQARFLVDLLLPGFEDEHAITVGVLESIPEDRKDWRPDPKAKTAFDLAWHIVNSERWFMEAIVAGEFTMDGDAGDVPPPEIASVADLVKRYRSEHAEGMERLCALDPDHWGKTLSMFGVFEMPTAQFLLLNNAHSIHHRGQLSTYLRPMGSKIPSIYGGSADEPMEMPGG